MIHRRSDNWELWSNVHPMGIGCRAEGREQCNCKYHVVDKDRSQIFAFESFAGADEKFCELSGELSLNSVFIKQI